MKRKNMTRNALVTSILALLLCVSMLVGTTFAWFTDSVESLNNVITAGNLDVEVTTGNGEDIQDQEVLFDDILWEPGVVAYENLNIENVGTLALKYALYINFANENYVIEADGTETSYGLASALKVAVVDGAVAAADRETLVNSITKWTSLEALSKGGKLYPAGSTEGASAETVGLVIYWEPSDADNNWNVQNGKITTDRKPLHIDLGIKVLATQLTYEEDSFDHLYDEDAKLAIDPAAVVKTISADGVDTVFYDIANGSIDLNNVQKVTLDTAYSFKGESPETAAQNQYADWFVDFFVSVDKAPQKGLFLSGQYDQFFAYWVAFEVPTGKDDNGNALIEPGKFYPLLGSVTGGGVSNWTYTEICEGVGTFNCGALDEQGLNAGTTMTVQLRLINPDDADDTIVVREVKYTFGDKPYPVNNSQELADAITAGYDDLYLKAGTYQMPAVAKGKTLTINGTHESVIEVVPAGQGEAGGQLDYNLDGSTVTFNGVTIKTNSQLYAGYTRLSAVYNDCVIQNTYNLGVGNSEFYDCTFNITNEYLRVGGAYSALFDGCTFNTDGRAILVYQDGTANAQTVTVKDCTFNATAAANTWNGIHVAAVSIDGTSGTYVVNLEGTNTVDSDFNGLWQIKTGASNVTVNE